MTIRHVVLDFDGTCTQIPKSQAAFLDEYRRLFQAVFPAAGDHWNEAIAAVRKASPESAWMLGGGPSAPAAADPYILSGEVVSYLVKKYDIQTPVPADVHARAYAAPASVAPWRDEVAEVLRGIRDTGAQVHFVSNSGTDGIHARLDTLLSADPVLRKDVSVRGSARKFLIQDLSAEVTVSAELRALFDELAGTVHAEPLERPVFLRRGKYFEALSEIWGDDVSAPASTLVCGDIWELDLAMPAALGCQVHLITREPPYDTYAYELRAVEALETRGGASKNLRGLLDRVRKQASNRGT